MAKSVPQSKCWFIIQLLISISYCSSTGFEVMDEFTSIDIMCQAVRQLAENVTHVADDVRAIKHVLGGSPSPQLYPSCSAILENGASHGTGWYWIKPECSAVPINVYCDQESGRGGWMRLHYKEGASTCFHNPEVTWNPQLVQCLGITGQGVDFAVSEDPRRVATGLSWLLRGSTWSDDSHIKMSNLLSCRTPAGSEWSLDYQGDYVYLTGLFETFGTFRSMYVGCNWTSRASVGEQLKLRMGGGAYHTGEFIHTACNGYGINTDNSVTSLWDSANTRVMWVRVSDHS